MLSTIHYQLADLREYVQEIRFRFASSASIVSGLQIKLLEPTGNIPPVEAEQRCYAMIEKQATAAWLKSIAF